MTMLHPAETDLFTTVVMAHPRRTETANRLASSLGPGARVVFDPEPDGSPNSSRTAALAWQHCNKTASHHMVLQDDAAPTPRILEAVGRAISAHPDAALALYANSNSWHGAASRVALLAGYGWVDYVPLEYYPTVAAVLPCAIAHEYAELAERQRNLPYEEDGAKDDMLMREFLDSPQYRAMVRTSALVEHQTMPTSICGNDLEEVRRAICLAGPTVSSIDEGRSLSKLAAWPSFHYGLARLKLPKEHDRTSWLTLDRADYLMYVGMSWDEICDLADEMWWEVAGTSDHDAAARTFLRELCLASYTLGQSLAAVQGMGSELPPRTPTTDAVLRSYAESGLAYESAVYLWADRFDMLIDVIWRVLELGHTRA